MVSASSLRGHPHVLRSRIGSIWIASAGVHRSSLAVRLHHGLYIESDYFSQRRAKYIADVEAPVPLSRNRVPGLFITASFKASRQSNDIARRVRRLFDEACRWPKVDHAGDGDRRQPDDRHSPIVPTGHRFLRTQLVPLRLAVPLRRKEPPPELVEIANKSFTSE
jgi:hypothetical protein